MFLTSSYVTSQRVQRVKKDKFHFNSLSVSSPVTMMLKRFCVTFFFFIFMTFVSSQENPENPENPVAESIAASEEQPIIIHTGDGGSSDAQMTGEESLPTIGEIINTPDGPQCLCPPQSIAIDQYTTIRRLNPSNPDFPSNDDNGDDESNPHKKVIIESPTIIV